jgi:tRNA dimethylallyltransferase
MLGPQAREALGYKQVLEHLRGQGTLEEAFEKTKILTRRFAKTQRTWLKRYRGVLWLAAAEMTPEALAHAVLKHLETSPGPDGSKAL